MIAVVFIGIKLIQLCICRVLPHYPQYISYRNSRLGIAELYAKYTGYCRLGIVLIGIYHYELIVYKGIEVFVRPRNGDLYCMYIAIIQTAVTDQPIAIQNIF